MSKGIQVGAGWNDTALIHASAAQYKAMHSAAVPVGLGRESLLERGGPQLRPWPWLAILFPHGWGVVF